jgi:hypothetical protein
MHLSIALSCLGFLPLVWAGSHNYLNLYDTHDCSGGAWGEAGIFNPGDCYYQLPPPGQHARSVTTVLVETQLGCYSKSTAVYTVL